MTLPADELYRRGVEHVNEGRHAAGRRALNVALARTDDPDLRARATGTLAYALQQTGDPDGAERLCRDALAMPGTAAKTRAILHGQLGSIALYSGRLDGAAADLTRAIDALEALDARSAEAANLRLNRSLVAMQRGALADAADDLAAAIAAFEADGDGMSAAMARHNLGYVALLRGDLVPAMDAMVEARRTLEESSAVVAATCDVDLAEVLRDAGLTTEAERNLESAARVFGARGMRQARAEAELNLARSLLTHDPVRAGKVARAAARHFGALGNEPWAARATGIRLRAALTSGAVTRTGARGARVRMPTEEETDAATAALQRLGLRSDAAALRLTAELARARTGRPGSGPVRIPRDAAMEVRLLAHEVRSARSAAERRDGDARRHAAEGLDVLSRWQRSFGSLDLQTSLVMHASGLMFEGLAAAGRSGRPEVLFEWSERARHLSQQVVPLRPSVDAETADHLAELRMLRAEAPTSDWLADPRAAGLRDRVRGSQWSGTGTADVEERVGLDAFAAGLDASTALITYVFTGDDLTCLVVTRDRAGVVPVAAWGRVRGLLAGIRADLDVSASVRTGPMVEVVRRALDARLEELSAALLQPAVDAAGDARRIVITLPGVLNGVPWGMLPAMRGRAFTLAQSATRWAGRMAVGRAPIGAVGFAVGPRVARGEEEVDAAAAAWDGSGGDNLRTPLGGAAATVDAVTALAASVDLLHVAAHGRHALDNPLFSGLDLADGTLFGYDIDRIPRAPDTVVLSACEVGRSSVRWGEEAIGMTRTWLHAGSGTVIAAPVIIADDVACELLGAVHTGLAAGLPPAEALAAASESTGHRAPFQAHGVGF